mgnify:CR=1 FL=1
MQPRKLNVFFAYLAYGGNGATASEVPDIRDWAVATAIKAAKDDRIDRISSKTFSDTPVDMVRNQIVETAIADRSDVLVMVDSDQKPDMYVGFDPTAKPFWDSSFDFLYEHWERGPSVIMAPYCGPPPHPIKGGMENVYAFYWANKESPDCVLPGSTTPADPLHGIGMLLDQYSRAETGRMLGIQECGAGPTGLSMWDMRAFELVRPPYFYYEWEGDGAACPHCHQVYPGKRSHKSSTEDVTATRDISLNGIQTLGYNPMFINWDAWAGHWKPRCVGKPTMIKADHVSHKLAAAVRANQRSTDRMVYVSRGDTDLNAHREAAASNGVLSNGSVESAPSP